MGNENIIKNAINDIKLYIDCNQVKDKIINDLGLILEHGKCKCFLHGENNPSMAFDNKHKRFKCFSCGQSYDIINHYQSYYGKSFIEAIRSIVTDFNLMIDLSIENSPREPIKTPKTHQNDMSKVIDYIKLRKISEETIKYANVKANKDNIVFEYRNELGEHISNKYRPARKIDKNNKKDLKMWFESGTNINTLYLMEKVDITKPLLICEGEFDALSAIEAGYKNTVSVPTGANSAEWLNTNWEFLEQVDECVIWFDNDEAGIKGAKEISSRLPNACKVVEYIKHNDINDTLYKEGKEEVLKAIRSAKSININGVSCLSDIGDFNIYEMKKMKTGLKEVDEEILGMCFGSINVLTGRNGSGKSTIINQIYVAEALSNNEKVFLFSGELIPSQTKYWLINTYANANQFSTYTNYEGMKYQKVSVEATEKIQNEIGERLFIYTDDDYSINTVIAKMEQLVKRNGVKIFILDNLMMLHDDISDELKAQTMITTKLKNFAKKYDALVHLVAHPRKNGKGDNSENVSKDDVAGSANITNLADYVTTIERNYNEANTEYDAVLKIVKNRHTGKNIGIKLMFDNARKRFYKEGRSIELDRDYSINSQEFIQIEGEF
ncbi:DnaB-like helicase C-terminal domain-containing protein [Romboutsia sp.]|uniref:DnaB-like helicase C-terminal domain-containing protein n=1 Tax=Romboutsia sp. TaxID=1965302 RepID=UPI002C698227|nr:DnaB-like helicase C-terminal domain-containing protein [Romboutsia sp.]HSQ88913.1 DnaB-like helicase C-terminal domain-containing protein [Romboutsia sp.]